MSENQATVESIPVPSVVSPVKVFIVDTNVVLLDPDCLGNFEDNIVVILEASLNEMERFKKEMSDRGAMTREFVRTLNDIDFAANLVYPSSLKSYYPNKVMFISNKEILKRCSDDGITLESLNQMSFDDLVFNHHENIIKVIRNAAFQRAITIESIVLVTNDKILLSKVNLMTLNLTAEFYIHNQIDVEQVYGKNIKVMTVSSELTKYFLDKMYAGKPLTRFIDFPEQRSHMSEIIIKEGQIGLNETTATDSDLEFAYEIAKFIKENHIKVNEHFELVVSGSRRATTFLAYRFIPNLTDELIINNQFSVNDSAIRVYSDTIEPFIARSKLYGINPRNAEQSIAASLIFNRSIKLVCLTGVAGTGKTLIAFAAGLEMVTNQPDSPYKRVVLVRPMEEVGKDMGALPGTLEEKMAPHLAAFGDCVDVVHKNGDKRTKGSSGLKQLVDMDIVEIQPLAYIRGRTISNSIIVIDEAQNLTPAHLKALITRAGENTKIVLCGDPDQCEASFMMKANNGLGQLIEKMDGEAIFAHINLTKGERSPLAAIAARLL